MASFKPYYNWNAFNTISILIAGIIFQWSFKPYYNWNAFNTIDVNTSEVIIKNLVLNLIITGMPSILDTITDIHVGYSVLNLIISGMPSILKIAFLIIKI